MRRIFRHSMILAAALFLTTAIAKAQPDGFSYQAVVRDSKGELVSNTKVGVRITLTDESGKTVMYRETQTALTNG